MKINEPFSFAPKARLLRDAFLLYFLFTKTDKILYFICIENRQQPARYDHNISERERKGARFDVVVGWSGVDGGMLLAFPKEKN